MPILDLEDFLTRIAMNDPAKPISLLLYQAVMFVSVVFIPIESLHEAGFKSRKAARKVFFQRVRLLYGLDCEDDHISLLQALLLMTYWYENPKDMKDTWYWMGISISLAQVLGMHRDPENLRISSRAKKLRKRIWWSCYIRDRLLALGIRRPARLRHQDFNVPMLTPDDFETPSVPLAMLTSICDWQFLQDAGLQKTLTMTLINLARLCVCVGNVLFSQYSILGDKSTRREADATTMVIPRQSIRQIQDLARCDVDLADWYESLEPACRYEELGARSSRQLDESKRIVWLHQAQLHMIYLTAVTVLHRPQALHSNSSERQDGSSSKHSRLKVGEAAVGISDLAYDLQRNDHLCYLSTSSIPAILWATFGHLTEIGSTRDKVDFASIGRFHQCLQALEELRAMYASADHAVWFLEAVIRRNGIRIPGFSLGRLANPSSSISESHSRHAQSMATSQRLDSSYSNGGRSHQDLITNGVDSTFNFYDSPIPLGNRDRGGYEISGEELSNSSQTLESPNLDMELYWPQSLMSFDSNLDSYIAPMPEMETDGTVIVEPR